jgi:peptidoglycan/LPS O-acetylase OafA/YrhL
METYYPASPSEVRRLGFLARRIRRLPPPVPFSTSFALVVEGGMANRGPSHPLKHRQENWQEEWMEDDDLLLMVINYHI